MAVVRGSSAKLGISVSTQTHAVVSWRSSQFRCIGEYNRKRDRHHDQCSLGGTSRELCSTDFDSIMTHLTSSRRMAKSGNTIRSLLMLVRYSSTAEQVGLCANVGTEFSPAMSWGRGSAAIQVTTFQGDLVGEAWSQPGSRRVLGGDHSPAK